MKSTKKMVALVVSIIVLGVLAFQFINETGPFQSNESSSLSDTKETEKVHVKRVVDGDTLIAINEQNEELKVRLIGIDTPETVKPNTPVQPYGKEASDYSKAQLEDMDVYLEYDKEQEDQYGRTLAYLWLNKNTMHNEQLVQKGLAREKYYAPNGKYRKVFQQAEEQAKDNNENIWS